MDKIYMDAKDKNVAKVVIYVDSSDESNAPFLDEKCTIPFPNAELCDAFLKGAILHDVNSIRGYEILVTGCYFDSKGLAHVCGIGQSGGPVIVPHELE